jgi:hypothetical protein
MSNNYKKIFDLFKTNKNISLLDLNTNTEILQNYYKQVSILENYKKEITDYIENYELKKINLTFLQKINYEYYTDLLGTKKIEIFSKKLIGDKNNLTTNQKNIEIFISKNDILMNTYVGYNEDLYFVNPLNTYLEDMSMIIKNDDDDVNIITDILTHGKIINITLPSVGIISKNVSKNDNTIINFINKIRSNKFLSDFDDIISELPLKHLGLADTISNLLLNIPIDTKNFNTNNNENNVRNLIKNMIKNISINENDIFKIKGKNNKDSKNGKNTSSFKKEFIIPYFFEGDKIKSMTKARIDKKLTINEVITNNNALITHVIEKYDITRKTINEKNRDIIETYKNIMASYLFYIINLIISIMDIYIDKINNDVILNIINLREKRFKILNIESTFDYILSFKKSILKFKIILLNNFYHLFIPSKINFGNYGMKMMDEGCYKPEGSFLNTIQDIFQKYPFTNKDNNNLKNFILNIKKNNDIYKENLILELGGFAFNNKQTKYALSSFKNTCVKISKINNFNLFIIDKIINYFQNKSIPIELINIDDIKIEMKSTLLNSKKNIKEKLQIKLIRKYEDNIEKSTSNYINLIEIRNKIKFSEKNNLISLYNKKDEFLLNFNIYYMISECIKKITEKYVYSSNLKNKLLEEYSRIKKEHEEKISDYIKK